MENKQTPTPAGLRETAETVDFFSLDIHEDGPSSFVPGTFRDCVTVNRPAFPGILSAAARLAAVYPKARCAVWHFRVPADGNMECLESVEDPAYYDTLETLAELARKNQEGLDALRARAEEEARA